MADEAILRILIKDDGQSSPDDGPPESARPAQPARQFAPPSPRESPAQGPARQPATPNQQLPPSPREPSQAAASAQPRDRYHPEPRQQQAASPTDPEFDPRAEAQKMRQAESRREQIQAAYDRMYGASQQTASAFDQTLDMAQKMRGTLGGVFGTLAGAGLDIITAYRDYQKDQQVAQRRQELLREPITPPAAGSRENAQQQPARREPIPQAAVPAAIPAAPMAAPPALSAEPTAQSKAIIAEANLALQALGHSQKEADQLLTQVMHAANKTFDNVQEVIQAAYEKKPAEQQPETREPETLPAVDRTQPAEKQAAPERPRRAERPDSLLGRERSAQPSPAQARPESVLGRERAAEPTVQAPPADAQQDFIMRDNDMAKPAAKPAQPASDAQQDFIMRDNAMAKPAVPQAKPAVAANAPPGAGASAPIAKAAPAAAAGTGAAGAGGAAAGGGAMAGAAAMAGPAAIVVAVVMALKAVQGAATDAVAGLGNFATAFASPDANPATMVSNIGDGTKAVSDKLFWVSPALGILGSMAGQAASSLGILMKAIDGTADRYGQYSPQIAQQQAQNEIKQVMGDLRRAQEAGPELARYLQAQGDLQQTFEEIKIKVLMKILPIVTNMLKILEGVMPAGEGIAEVISALALPLSTLAQVATEILGVQQDANRPPLVGDPTETLLQTNGNPGVRVPNE